MQQEIDRIILQILLLVVLLALSGCSSPTAVSAEPSAPNLPAAPNNNIALGKVGQGEGTAVQETAPPTQVVSESGLYVGDIAFVIAPPDNIVRQSPGLNGRRIGGFPAGSVLEIREGPIYANGMTWWRAYSRGQNLIGWTSEGQNAELFLAPVIGRTVCADTYRTRLTAGSRAYVLADPPEANLVRSGAGTNFGVNGRIQPNQSMQIIGGPLCVQNMIWWQVVSDNNPQLVGWTSEGDWSNYFLAPVSIP